MAEENPIVQRYGSVEIIVPLDDEYRTLYESSAMAEKTDIDVTEVAIQQIYHKWCSFSNIESEFYIADYYQKLHIDSKIVNMCTMWCESTKEMVYLAKYEDGTVIMFYH